MGWFGNFGNKGLSYDKIKYINLRNCFNEMFNILILF